MKHEGTLTATHRQTKKERAAFFRTNDLVFSNMTQKLKGGGGTILD